MHKELQNGGLCVCSWDVCHEQERRAVGWQNVVYDPANIRSGSQRPQYQRADYL
jgi:hypothetical protein